MDFKLLRKKISELTDINDHNQAVLKLALELNAKRHIKAMQGVIQIHEAIGSMPSGLIDVRSQITNELLQLIRMTHSKEEALKMQNVF